MPQGNNFIINVIQKGSETYEIIQANLQASGREKKAVTVYGSNKFHRASFDQRK